MTPAPSVDALAWIAGRRNVAPRRLAGPGPDEAQQRLLFEAAAAAPDHGSLRPWRFVIVPLDRRDLLGDAFVDALRERDAQADEAQLSAAREKAQRAPFLVLAVVRLQADAAESEPPDQRENVHPGAYKGPTSVDNAERLVSLGCAVQNMLLAAQSLGFASGLASGKALSSAALRRLFRLDLDEQAVCFINVGTPTTHKPPRPRPPPSEFVRSL